MEYDLDIDFATACLRMAQAKLRVEQNRVLELDLIYGGMDRARAEAVQRQMDRTLDESKNRVHDLLMKQRLDLERRFGSVETNAGQRTGTSERP